MHAVLSVVIVLTYAVALTFVAVRARAAREYSEFSLARRRLPLALVFGSLVATYVGPGFSISFVGRGFNSGFLFLLVGLAYSVQNILVGFLVAPKLRSLRGCHTLGGAIGLKYGRWGQVLAGLISVLVCTALAAVMASAGGVVLTNVYGLVARAAGGSMLPASTLPIWSSVVIIVGITALYTTFGGLRASVVTDAFQFAAFATLLPLTLIVALLCNLHGGASEFGTQAVAGTQSGLRSTSGLQIVGLVAAFLLGETLIPPYAHRALASESTAVSRNGFVLAGLFSVVWFVAMIALGIVARGLLPTATDEDYVLLELVESVMPAEVHALLLVVLVSVVMSSFDSLLNAGAVAFTEDIVRPITRLSDETALHVGRAATILIAIIAAAGAVTVPTIIRGLLVCYTIWASAILPTLVLGLWLREPRPIAGISSMLVGTTAAVVFQFAMPRISPSTADVPAIIPALALAVVAYLIGHCLGGSRMETRP